MVNGGLTSNSPNSSRRYLHTMVRCYFIHARIFIIIAKNIQIEYVIMNIFPFISFFKIREIIIGKIIITKPKNNVPNACVINANIGSWSY
jgi:hypothetical protein